ncbi:MAG: glycosyltransferase [Pseudohaliea sp.]
MYYCGYRRQYPQWLYPGRGDRDEANAALIEPGLQPLIDSLNPLSLRQAAGEVAAFEPALIVLPWWTWFWAPHMAYLVPALRRRLPGCRIVFLCHNARPHEQHRLGNWLAWRTLALGDAVLTQSRQDEAELRMQLTGVPVAFVEHPSYRFYDSESLQRSSAREQLALTRPTLLFFGFVRRYKGLDILLRALPEVLQVLDVELVVAGEFWEDTGDYDGLVRSLALEGRVRIENRYLSHEEVATYFAAADAVVLPYRSVTASGVAKLAFGCGRAVIASDLAPLRDAVTHDVTGLLFTPEDPQALAAQLIHFFADNRQSDLEANIRTRSQGCDWSTVVRALEAFAPSGTGMRKNRGDVHA